MSKTPGLPLLALLLLAGLSACRPSLPPPPTPLPITPAPTIAGAAGAKAPAVAQTTGVPDLVVDRSKLAPQIRLYTWPNYLDPAVLEDFRREYGVIVRHDIYPNNEELLENLLAPGADYDLIAPSDYMVANMIGKNLLEPLDLSRLPHFANLDPRNLQAYYDPDNRYSLPWRWGTTGIAYDSAQVQPPPTSWQVMFDTRYAGRILMLEDPREVPAATAHLLGLSANTTSRSDLERIAAKMREQKPLVKAYTSTDNRAMLAAGTVALAHIYTGDALKAAETRPTIKYMIPQEGATIWQDNLAIPRLSPHKYTAQVLLDYLLRADVEARNIAHIKFPTPNLAAQASLPPTVLNDPAIYPPLALREKLEWLQDLGDEFSLYEDLWAGLQAP